MQSIKAAVKKGPVLAFLSALNDVFKLYKAGIIREEDGCQGDDLDHIAVIVGWGRISRGLEYYIVKNSFGATWGENGYFRIEITEGKGACGINQDIHYVNF